MEWNSHVQYYIGLSSQTTELTDRFVTEDFGSILMMHI